MKYRLILDKKSLILIISLQLKQTKMLYIYLQLIISFHAIVKISFLVSIEKS